jgi:hypothetical protein
METSHLETEAESGFQNRIDLYEAQSNELCST